MVQGIARSSLFGGTLVDVFTSAGASPVRDASTEVSLTGTWCLQTRDSYTLCQWELHTIPAPPRLVWSVQHVDTLFTTPVDTLVACFPTQYMRFGAHAPLNADHAGIDAIEPLP